MDGPLADPASLTQPAAAPHARGGAASRKLEATEADDADDQALLAAFAAGDSRAFARLYERHERPVYRFLRRSLNDHAAADDVMQEVWIAVMRNAPTFEPRARFTTWLYTIVRSRLIDHWRARKPWIAIDDLAANDPDEPAADPSHDWLAADRRMQPEVRFDRKAEAQAFVAAVERLPIAQREAFLLHAEAGCSVEEVARLTGVGHETAKSRLRYAMSRLRTALEAWR